MTVRGNRVTQSEGSMVLIDALSINTHGLYKRSIWGIFVVVLSTPAEQVMEMPSYQLKFLLFSVEGTSRSAFFVFFQEHMSPLASYCSDLCRYYNSLLDCKLLNQKDLVAFSTLSNCFIHSRNLTFVKSSKCLSRYREWSLNMCSWFFKKIYVVSFYNWFGLHVSRYYSIWHWEKTFKRKTKIKCFS